MKIFVISLPDCTDRRRQMEEQMRAQGLDFEFLDAVDGRSGLPPEYESLVDREATRRNLGRDMSSGEIGCALSHALAYEAILERGLAEAIILEDDMRLHPDFGSMVRSGCLQESRRDLLLFFSFEFRAFKWLDRPFFREHRRYAYATLPSSSGAYYLTQRGARQLHDAAIPISFVADWPLLIQFRMRTGGIYPHLAEPFGEESSLEDERSVLGRQVDAGEVPPPPPADWKTELVLSLKRFLSHLYCEWLLPSVSWEVRPYIAQVAPTDRGTARHDPDL